MNPPPDWTPETVRGELRRLQELIDTDKCPRDKATIAKTARDLNGRRAIIRDRAERRPDGSIELWTAALSTSAALFISVTAASLKASGPIGALYVAILSAAPVVFAFSLWRVLEAKKSAKAKKNDELTVSEYDALVSLLRQQVDNDRTYAKREDDTYAPILGSKDEMSLLQDMHNEIIYTRPTMSAPCPYPELIRSIDRRLARYRGRDMTEEFRALFVETERLLIAWRDGTPTTLTEEADNGA